MDLLRAILVTALLFAPAKASAQTETNPKAVQRIEIILERNENGAWTPIDSRLILEQNDRIRFRMRTNFGGYLYVTNQSTSGAYQVLFPVVGSNGFRIEAGQEYIVPATDSWFRISGPPGHEVVYWVISPVDLNPSVNRPPANTQRPKNPTLFPRCDDSIFRERGDCMDTAAGARQIGNGNEVPSEVSQLPRLRSRDLIFIREQTSSIVSSPGPLNGPVIYEFRIAHR